MSITIEDHKVKISGAKMNAHSEIQAPRPPWREEYLRDLPALEQYCADLRTWQRNSNDSFERTEADLWSRINAHQACTIFNRTLELFERFDATGELEVARIADNELRRAVGEPVWCEAEYRTRFAREFALIEILKLVPAMEA